MSELYFDSKIVDNQIPEMSFDRLLEDLRNYNPDDMGYIELDYNQIMELYEAPVNHIFYLPVGNYKIINYPIEILNQLEFPEYGLEEDISNISHVDIRIGIDNEGTKVAVLSLNSATKYHMSMPVDYIPPEKSDEPVIVPVGTKSVTDIIDFDNPYPFGISNASIGIPEPVRSISRTGSTGDESYRDIVPAILEIENGAWINTGFKPLEVDPSISFITYLSLYSQSEDSVVYRLSTVGRTNDHSTQNILVSYNKSSHTYSMLYDPVASESVSIYAYSYVNDVHFIQISQYNTLSYIGLYSTDGDNWIPFIDKIDDGDTYITSIIFRNDEYILSAYNRTITKSYLYTSTDLINWSLHDISINNEVNNYVFVYPRLYGDTIYSLSSGSMYISNNGYDYTTDSGFIADTYYTRTVTGFGNNLAYTGSDYRTYQILQSDGTWKSILAPLPDEFVFDWVNYSAENLYFTQIDDSSGYNLTTYTYILQSGDLPREWILSDKLVSQTTIVTDDGIAPSPDDVEIWVDGEKVLDIMNEYETPFRKFVEAVDYQSFGYAPESIINPDGGESLRTVNYGGLILYKNSSIGKRSMSSQSTMSELDIDTLFVTISTTPRDWVKIISSPIAQLVIAKSSRYLSRSTHGINWEEIDIGITSDWVDGVYDSANSQFVLISKSGIVARSEDGIIWTTSMIGIHNQEWRFIVYDLADSRYYILPDSGGIWAYSDDSITWITDTLPFSNPSWAMMCTHNNQIFIIPTIVDNFYVYYNGNWTTIHNSDPFITSSTVYISGSLLYIPNYIISNRIPENNLDHFLPDHSMYWISGAANLVKDDLSILSPSFTNYVNGLNTASTINRAPFARTLDILTTIGLSPRGNFDISPTFNHYKSSSYQSETVIYTNPRQIINIYPITDTHIQAVSTGAFDPGNGNHIMIFDSYDNGSTWTVNLYSGIVNIVTGGGFNRDQDQFNIFYSRITQRYYSFGIAARYIQSYSTLTDLVNGQNGISATSVDLFFKLRVYSDLYYRETSESTFETAVRMGYPGEGKVGISTSNTNIIYDAVYTTESYPVAQGRNTTHVVTKISYPNEEGLSTLVTNISTKTITRYMDSGFGSEVDIKSDIPSMIYSPERNTFFTLYRNSIYYQTLTDTSEQTWSLLISIPVSDHPYISNCRLEYDIVNDNVYLYAWFYDTGISTRAIVKVTSGNTASIVHTDTNILMPSRAHSDTIMSTYNINDKLYILPSPTTSFNTDYYSPSHATVPYYDMSTIAIQERSSEDVFEYGSNKYETIQLYPLAAEKYNFNHVFDWGYKRVLEVNQRKVSSLYMGGKYYLSTEWPPAIYEITSSGDLSITHIADDFGTVKPTVFGGMLIDNAKGEIRYYVIDGDWWRNVDGNHITDPEDPSKSTSISLYNWVGGGHANQAILVASTGQYFSFNIGSSPFLFDVNGLFRPLDINIPNGYVTGVYQASTLIYLVTMANSDKIYRLTLDSSTHNISRELIDAPYDTAIDYFVVSDIKVHFDPAVSIVMNEMNPIAYYTNDNGDTWTEFRLGNKIPNFHTMRYAYNTSSSSGYIYYALSYFGYFSYTTGNDLSSATWIDMHIPTDGEHILDVIDDFTKDHILFITYSKVYKIARGYYKLSTPDVKFNDENGNWTNISVGGLMTYSTYGNVSDVFNKSDEAIVPLLEAEVKADVHYNTFDEIPPNKLMFDTIESDSISGIDTNMVFDNIGYFAYNDTDGLVYGLNTSTWNKYEWTAVYSVGYNNNRYYIATTVPNSTASVLVANNPSFTGWSHLSHFTAAVNKIISVNGIIIFTRRDNNPEFFLYDTTIPEVPTLFNSDSRNVDIGNVIFSSNNYVAISIEEDAIRIYRSADLVTWTNEILTTTLDASATLSDIVRFGGKEYALYGSNLYANIDNTWAIVTIPDTGERLNKFLTFNETLYVVTETGKSILSTTNGSTWQISTDENYTNTSVVKAIAHDGFAINTVVTNNSNDGIISHTSFDLAVEEPPSHEFNIVDTVNTMPDSNVVTWSGIIHTGTGFMGTLANSINIPVSSDGKNWTYRVPNSSYIWYDIIINNGITYALHKSGSYYYARAGIVNYEEEDNTLFSKLTSSHINISSINPNKLQLVNNVLFAINGEGSGDQRILYRILSKDYFSSSEWDDTNKWKSATLPSGVSQIWTIGYNNGIYIACALSGEILKSTDLMTWDIMHEIPSPSFVNITSFNKYFIIGYKNELLFSTDGDTWLGCSIDIELASSVYILKVLESNGTLYAVTNTNIILYSIDGILWHSYTTATSVSIMNSYVITMHENTIYQLPTMPSSGSDNKMRTISIISREVKPDPIAAVSITDGTFTLDGAGSAYPVRAFTSRDYQHLIVDSNGAFWISLQGDSWSISSEPYNSTSVVGIVALTSSNSGVEMDVIVYSSRIYTTTDNYTTYTSVLAELPSGFAAKGARLVNDKVVVFDDTNIRILSSNVGETLSFTDAMIDSTKTVYFNNMTYNEKAGLYLSVIPAQSTDIIYLMTSTDFVEWNITEFSEFTYTGSSSSSIDFRYTDSTVFNDKFFILHYGEILSSNDGVVWNRTILPNTKGLIYNLEVYKGLLVVVGEYGELVYTKDGINWFIDSSGIHENTWNAPMYTFGNQNILRVSRYNMSNVSGYQDELVTKSVSNNTNFSTPNMYSVSENAFVKYFNANGVYYLDMVRDAMSIFDGNVLPVYRYTLNSDYTDSTANLLCDQGYVAVRMTSSGHYTSRLYFSDLPDNNDSVKPYDDEQRTPYLTEVLAMVQKIHPNVTSVQFEIGGGNATILSISDIAFTITCFIDGSYDYIVASLIQRWTKSGTATYQIVAHSDIFSASSLYSTNIMLAGSSLVGQPSMGPPQQIPYASIYDSIWKGRNTSYTNYNTGKIGSTGSYAYRYNRIDSNLMVYRTDGSGYTSKVASFSTSTNSVLFKMVGSTIFGYDSSNDKIYFNVESGSSRVYTYTSGIDTYTPQGPVDISYTTATISTRNVYYNYTSRKITLSLNLDNSEIYDETDRYTIKEPKLTINGMSSDDLTTIQTTNIIPVNNKFVVGLKDKLLESIDGITWDAKYTLPEVENVRNDVYNIRYYNGKYYIVVRNRAIDPITAQLYSGTSYSDVEYISDIGTGNIINKSYGIFKIYNDIIFVSEGRNNTYKYSSDLGLSWADGTYSTSDIYICNIVYLNDVFYAIGKASYSATTNIILNSTDGITWTSQREITNSSGGDHDIHMVYYNNRYFLIEKTNLHYSTDTITWNKINITTTPLPQGYSGYSRWEDLLIVNGTLYAISDYRTIAWTSDGLSWQTYHSLETLDMFNIGSATSIGSKIVQTDIYGGGVPSEGKYGIKIFDIISQELYHVRNKDKYGGGITVDSINEQLDTLVTDTTTDTATSILTDIRDDVNNALTLYDNTYPSHLANHFTAEDKAVLQSRASGDHEHFEDDRVTVNIEDLGPIPSKYDPFPIIEADVETNIDSYINRDTITANIPTAVDPLSTPTSTLLEETNTLLSSPPDPTMNIIHKLVNPDTKDYIVGGEGYVSLNKGTDNPEIISTDSKIQASRIASGITVDSIDTTILSAEDTTALYTEMTDNVPLLLNVDDKNVPMFTQTTAMDKYLNSTDYTKYVIIQSRLYPEYTEDLTNAEMYDFNSVYDVIIVFDDPEMSTGNAFRFTLIKNGETITYPFGTVYNEIVDYTTFKSTYTNNTNTWTTYSDPSNNPLIVNGIGIIALVDTISDVFGILGIPLPDDNGYLTYVNNTFYTTTKGQINVNDDSILLDQAKYDQLKADYIAAIGDINDPDNPSFSIGYINYTPSADSVALLTGSLSSIMTAPHAIFYKGKFYVLVGYQLIEISFDGEHATLPSSIINIYNITPLTGVSTKLFSSDIITTGDDAYVIYGVLITGLFMLSIDDIINGKTDLSYFRSSSYVALSFNRVLDIIDTTDQNLLVTGSRNSSAPYCYEMPSMKWYYASDNVREIWNSVVASGNTALPYRILSNASYFAIDFYVANKLRRGILMTDGNTTYCTFNAREVFSINSPHLTTALMQFTGLSSGALFGTLNTDQSTIIGTSARGTPLLSIKISEVDGKYYTEVKPNPSSGIEPLIGPVSGIPIMNNDEFIYNQVIGFTDTPTKIADATYSLYDVERGIKTALTPKILPTSDVPADVIIDYTDILMKTAVDPRRRIGIMPAPYPSNTIIVIMY